MESNPFNIQEYVQDAIAVAKDPKGFYEAMPTTGGFNEPIMRALFFALVTGAFAFVLAFISFSGGGIGSRVYSAFTGLIMFPVVGIIGLFFGAVIILVFSAIAGGNTDYEATTRVAASTTFLMPVQAFANFFGSINPYLGGVVSAGISLFAIYLFYNALMHALNANEKPAKIITGIFAVLTVVGLVAMAANTARANKFLKESQEAVKESQKLIEQLNNRAAEQLNQ